MRPEAGSPIGRESAAGPVSDRYAATLEWLFGLEVSRGWDLKLETVRAALDRFGAPERGFPSLHVAGTNGKGSVAAMAQAVLAVGGRRVGLYTSPHLEDFRERIRIGERRIGEGEVVGLVDEVRAAVEGTGVELTFFEFATVIAFLHFARSGVDAAMVEVGLGGRLDATNVLEPKVSVVTTIGFDHERFLGSTAGEIAAEKGGILKPGVPAVFGRIEGEALAVLERIARERGSRVRRLGRDFHAVPSAVGFDYVGRRRIAGIRPGLPGRFQIDNAAVALAALEEAGWLEGSSDDDVRRALAGARWAGRLETLHEHPRIVVDGAHNPAGVEALAAEIPVLFGDRRPRLVFGVLADKRWEEMVARLAPLVSEVVVVPVRERRSVAPDPIAQAFSRSTPTRIAGSGLEAVDLLLAESDGPLLIAGSLFLVGEVRSGLLAHPR